MLPSPSTSSAARCKNNETAVSVHCVNFNVNDAGVALSVPTATLTNGYDSDDECGPFFDAVSGEASEEESDGEDETPPAQTETTLTANPKTPLLTEEKIKKIMLFSSRRS